MARRKQPKLPEPQPAIPAQYPSASGGTYIALIRQTDRYLAKAEEAIRNAALLWSDVDSGLEATCEVLAEHVLQTRREAVETVSDLYGDRLREGSL